MFSRNFLAIVAGVLAGVLGLTGLLGFLCYLLVMLLGSLALLAKTGFNVKHYFDSRSRVVTEGLLNGAMVRCWFRTRDAVTSEDILH